jgi:hypothetical protein
MRSVTTRTPLSRRLTVISSVDAADVTGDGTSGIRAS